MSKKDERILASELVITSKKDALNDMIELLERSIIEAEYEKEDMVLCIEDLRRAMHFLMKEYAQMHTVNIGQSN